MDALVFITITYCLKKEENIAEGCSRGNVAHMWQPKNIIIVKWM